MVINIAIINTDHHKDAPGILEAVPIVAGPTIVAASVGAGTAIVDRGRW